jgi:hypothetical protein
MKVVDGIGFFVSKRNLRYIKTKSNYWNRIRYLRSLTAYLLQITRSAG